MRHWIPRFRAFAIVVLLCLPGGGALAHLGIHEQIEALDRQIRDDPGNAALYLRRGDLHRIHRDWAAARRDFAAARRLKPDFLELDLLEGLTHLEAGEPDEAVLRLNRLLERDPGNVKGLLARAQANSSRKRYQEAEADYTAAIAQFHGERTPRPEMYLERAQAQAAQGEAALAAAIRGLDEGLARLGPVVSLELYAVELLMRKGEVAAALERVRRAATGAGNRVSWLVREAEILEAWDREGEAREAYARALAALRSTGSRKTPLSVALETRLDAAIRRLTRDADSPAATAPAPAS